MWRQSKINGQKPGFQEPLGLLDPLGPDRQGKEKLVCADTS
jgi:hypothetical protein